MLLKDLLRGLKVLNSKGSIDVNIESIVYDSRNARKGSLFICIEGFKSDGHKYIDKAVNNGAKVFIVQKDVCVPADITVIRVEDTRYALSHISDIYFNSPSKRFPLIGVTGTKGKTTITYMIKSILEDKNQKVGLIGTIENSIGDEKIVAERTTPESYDLQGLFDKMLKNKVDSVVMEVSSHALELHRVSRSDYDIGIFTNLSRDHLDFHNTFENYLNAKVKLFDMCKNGIVNIDNPYGKEVVKKAKCPILTFAIECNADIRATEIKMHPDSVEFTVNTPWGSSDVKVNIPGIFSVYNALAAIAACRLMNVSFEHIKAGLGRVSVPGRAEVINTDKNFTIMIDYAHSPDSLENILSMVKGYAKGRVVSVFGCGGDRDKTKRPIMGEISGRIADFTIITSDNPRTESPEEILKDIEAGIEKTDSKYITIPDRKEAIKYSIENAQKDDIIVLAGKGHETYQIFNDKTIHFDEREVIKEILT